MLSEHCPLCSPFACSPVTREVDERREVTLGRDIAASFDMIIWVFDIKTFLAGACLIRLVPVQSLWPVTEALLSDFNKQQTLDSCGYPRGPTHLFKHIIQALAQRDPVGLHHYMQMRFMTCGAKAGEWFSRHCLSQVAKPAHASIPAPYPAPKTRGKRRRECDSV